MIRIALLIFALVVATTLLLPVPAGWAWALVLTGAAAWYLRARSQAAYRWVTLSAIWKCPYCLTAKPLGASICRYCGSDLIVAKETNEAPEPELERELPATTPPERAIVGDVAGTLETITRSLSHAARALRLIADPRPPAPPPPPLELLPPPTTEEDPATHDPPPL